MTTVPDTEPISYQIDSPAVNELLLERDVKVVVRPVADTTDVLEALLSPRRATNVPEPEDEQPHFLNVLACENPAVLSVVVPVPSVDVAKINAVSICDETLKPFVTS